MSQSIYKRVLNRIAGPGRGWVFTPAHIKDLGSRTAVATAGKISGTVIQAPERVNDFETVAVRI